MTFCFFPLIPIKSIAILSSVAIASGSYLFVVGFRLLARQRSLLTTPTSKIGGATRGLVEVSGVVAGPCTTVAPITEEPCFLYHTTAWQQRDGQANEWEKVADETLHLPFFIDDSTGRLLIEARDADLELLPRFRGDYAPTTMGLEGVPLSVRGFLSRHAIVLNRPLRIEEQLIKADDEIFVAGTLMENPGVQAPALSPRGDVSIDRRNPVRGIVRNVVRNDDRRNSAGGRSSEPLPAPDAPEVIRLASAAAASTREMSQQAKIAAAITRASGKPQGWSAAELPDAVVVVDANAPPATISAPSEARPDEAHPNENRPNENRPNQDQPESLNFDLAPLVVLMKGKDDPTFVISFRSQKEIVSATTWKAAAIVCGGTAISLLGLYALLL